MIISRTPLRVSFAGGGTDLRAYYSREPGAVTSTAIDKYVYITVNQKFDDKIRIKYSETEHVDSVDDLKHPLFRETMKMAGVTSGVEVTSLADIPTAGSGLGSSSTFTVGLLNALYAYQGKAVPAETLAQQACEIEIEILKEPIGKQDQYIAAYGGLQHIEFNPDEKVAIDPVICTKSARQELQDRLLLFYTGITRKSSTILTEQKKNTSQEEKFRVLTQMRDLSRDIAEAVSAGNLEEFGELLHKGWELKKQMASGISNPEIDQMYKGARNAGALGGKISGAGGGGFMLLFAEDGRQESVRASMKKYKELPFEFEPQGSKIIFVEG